MSCILKMKKTKTQERNISHDPNIQPLKKKLTTHELYFKNEKYKHTREKYITWPKYSNIKNKIKNQRHNLPLISSILKQKTTKTQLLEVKTLFKDFIIHKLIM